MRKDWARYVLMGVVILAVTSLLGSFALRGEEAAQDQKNIAAKDETIVRQHEPLMTEQKPPLYRLGIWQGRVAVYDGRTNALQQVTEMPVSSLPDPDQVALKQGITVYTQLELAQLLEDYGS